MDPQLTTRSAEELVTSIASGEVGVVEVVEAHLDRIDEVNGDINAIVSTRSREEILAEAAAAQHVDTRGPLHGLPVAVKDLEDVAGLPTRHGSQVTSARPADVDGHIAHRLRRAGAIIIGKTNTPEFGTGSHTFNDVFGLTRNPWNLDRSAGGSSGGAAAALAAGMVPIADGSDLGGSLRNPAAMCGVVGMRPSVGRVAQPEAKLTHPRLGVSGPMARSVADTALLLGVLAGPDNRDPRSRWDPLPEVWNEPSPSSLRVAWGGDLGLFRVDGAVLEQCQLATESMASAGAFVDDALPDLRHAELVFRTLRGVTYRNLGQDIPQERHGLLKSTVRENIAFGSSLTVDDVLRAELRKSEIHRLMAEFFEHWDVLALPTTQVPAFDAALEYPTHIEGEPVADYLDWMMSCCVITATECPAISIPAGLTAEGLPIGLQLVAPVGQDQRLLEIAMAFESVLADVSSPTTPTEGVRRGRGAARSR